MTLNNKISVAILGCGRIAGIKDSPKSMGSITTHAQAFHRHDRFEIIAVCDNNSKRLMTFQTKWAIPNAYNELNKMLINTNPNVISVCTATSSHFTDLCTILESSSPPKVIFVEKPICQTNEELEKLKELSSKSSTKIIVNHSRRYDPVHNEIAIKVRKKDWGELIEAYCFYYGGWLNNGTHIIDTLRMFLGDNIEIETVESGQDSGRDEDPCYDCLLINDNSKIHIRSFPEKYYQLFEFDFRFEKGRLSIKDFGEDIIFEKQIINDIGESVLKLEKGYPLRGLDNPLFHAAERIYNYLEVKSDTTYQIGTTIEDAQKTMKLIWSISSLGNISINNKNENND